MTVAQGILVEKQKNGEIQRKMPIVKRRRIHQPSRDDVVKECCNRLELLARRIYSSDEGTLILFAHSDALLNGITDFRQAAQITETVLMKEEIIQVGNLTVTYYGLG